MTAIHLPLPPLLTGAMELSSIPSREHVAAPHMGLQEEAKKNYHNRKDLSIGLRPLTIHGSVREIDKNSG